MNRTSPTRAARPPLVRALLALTVAALETAMLAWAMGGLQALTSHPRALALVALWAGSGVTLTLLRPPLSRDAVARAAEGRLLLASLGLVPLAVAPLAAWGERIGLWSLPGGGGLRWAGVAVAAAGLAIRIAAMAQLGTRFTPVLAVQPGHVLETRGIYARVRHPGYLGSFLTALGAALAFGSGAGLVPVAFLGVLLALRVRREEALLAEHFGAAWRAYRSKTGAFLPRF